MTQPGQSVMSNELIQLLIEARTEMPQPAAVAMLRIAQKYGLKGLECLAVLGSVNYVPTKDFIREFLVKNAGIDPLTIQVV